MSEAQVKRERGTGRIFVRGQIAWIQFSQRGLQVRESTGISIDTPDWEKRAGKELRKRIGEVEAGIARDSRGLRYEDLRDAYLSDYELSGRKSLRRDRQGKPFLECVRRLDDFFSGFRAVDIGPDIIRKFQQDQRKAGLANGSINRAVAALRRMFSLAQRDGQLRNMPFFPMLSEAKPRTGTLPHKSYQALIAELPDYLRPVVVMGFRTGMRLGEILGLTWPNVNWMEKIIRLDDSKNNEAREIPFSGELEIVLREQYAKRRDGCDRVCFRMSRLGHAGPIGNFRKPWRRACVKIGVGRMEPVRDAAGQPVFEKPRYPKSKPKPTMKYAGLIFHDLRRTFITDAEHSHAPRHEVMKISGHKTESVYKRYAIENREQRRAALAQIDEYRDQKFGDNSGTIEGSPRQEEAVIH